MNRIQTYTQNQTESLDGFDMILQAFEAIIRGMKKAKTAITEKDYAEQHRILTVCANLLLELETTLPIAEQMDGLRASMVTMFQYARNTIVEANKKSDSTLLEKVESMFIKIHATTEKMKSLPDFKSVQQTYQNIQPAQHSQQRFTMQDNVLSSANDDMLLLLSAYQNSLDKKEQDLLHNNN